MTKRVTLDLREALERCPLIFTHDGLEARWLPNLEKYGQFRYVEELGAGAWGQLSGCGWHDELPEAAALMDDGRLDPAWADAMVEAARSLASSGSYQGPSGDASHWLSYLMHALSAHSSIFRRIVEDNGSLPLEVGG